MLVVWETIESKRMPPLSWIFRNIYCSAKPRSHGVKAAGRNTKDDIGDLVVTDCQLAQLLSTNVHNFSLSGT